MRKILWVCALLAAPGFCQSSNSANANASVADQQNAAASAADSSQSLADLARQRGKQKAVRAFTEDDLPARHSVEPTVAPQATAGAQAAPVNPADSAPKCIDDSCVATHRDANLRPYLAGTATPEHPSAEQEAAAREFIKAKMVQINAVSAERSKCQEQLVHEQNDANVRSLTACVQNLAHNLEVWSSQRNAAEQLLTNGDNDRKAAKEPQPKRQ